MGQSDAYRRASGGRGFNNARRTTSRRINERTDKRQERRGLGAERTLIYRTALETGHRKNELRTLTRGCIDLDGLTITVWAGYSKLRREDAVPIRAELAATMGPHLEHKAPAAGRR